MKKYINMIQLLHTFLENGESIGIESLTTPIDDPPNIESPRTTKPVAFLQTSITAIKFYLVIGKNKVNPAIPSTNPIHKLAECVVALQAITTNYDINRIAVTCSFGPFSKALVKHNNHAKLKTLDNRPIPSNLILKSSSDEQQKKRMINRTLMKAWAVQVRVKLS
jgi:hypothetical protein